VIEPTWQSGDVTLYRADCLDVLPTLPEGIVDAVVTDPPYGIGESGRKNASRSHLAATRDYGDYDWDAERAPSEAIAMLRRLSRQQVIWGGIYYTDILPPSSSWIVWDKNNSGDFADCELAWTSHKKAARLFKWTWNGFIKQRPERRWHPTQKPIALMKWVVEGYTQSGATVLDPFMGSGTTGVACVQTGRPFIGIEIDERYFDIAVKRITEAQMQQRLPMGEEVQA